jgi:hypothetical protein
MCRRAHGAAFVTWVGIDNDRFSVTEGHDHLRWHHSSENAERGFCSECGSTMFFRGAKWPGEIHVARSCFDGDIDLAPQGHGYWETHVPWVTLGDELPRKTST